MNKSGSHQSVVRHISNKFVIHCAVYETERLFGLVSTELTVIYVRTYFEAFFAGSIPRAIGSNQF